MTIPTLPTAPARTMSQDTFDAAVEAWIAALDAWTNAVNALGITTITGSIQSTPIGNVTPSTGAFTTLSASGNIGVGTTLSAWVGYKTVQVGSGAAFCGYAGDVLAAMSSNAYNDNVNWRYILSGNEASFYRQSAGVHLWVNAPSGTAGATITFTERMSLSSTGLAVTGNISATTTIKTGGYTVATLPAGASGDRAYVTDATTPTYLGTLTGGGAVVCPVFKNASAWVSA